MLFWKYFSFLASISFRKISIYLTLLLYWVYVSLVTYLLPELVNRDIISIYASETVISLQVLLLVIASTVITIKVFMGGNDDGLDLLVSSKPINKTTVVWTKYLTINIFNLLNASISVIIVSFTNLSVHNQTDITSSLCLSTFLATFLISFIWGSLAIFISNFFHKATVLVAIIGLQMILLLMSVIIYFAAPAQNEAFAKNNIQVNGLGLVSKKEDGKLEYHNYAYAYYDHKPIDNNTIYNGSKLDQQNLDPANFLNVEWSKSRNLANTHLLNIINIDNQFISMYRMYSPSVLLNIDIQPQLVHISQKNYNLHDWNYEFGTENSTILNNDDLVNWNNALLTINNGAEIFDSERYLSEINTITSQMSGEISNELISPEITLPIFELDANNQWLTRTFINLNEFVNYYYSTQNLNYAEQFINSLTEVVTNKADTNVSSFYSSLLLTYLYKKLDIHNLKEMSKGEKLIKYYTTLSFQFQYWTFKALQESKTTHNWDDKVIKSMQTVLNYDPQNPQQTVTNWVLLDNPNMFAKKSRQIKRVSNPLTLRNKNDLLTIASVNTKIEYDYVPLFVTWSMVGLIFGLLGMAINLRKDIA